MIIVNKYSKSSIRDNGEEHKEITWLQMKKQLKSCKMMATLKD